MASFNQTHQQLQQQRQHSSDQHQHHHQQQQQPLDSQQQHSPHFRHQRTLSITSQTSSHSISHHPLPILSSPALSFASVPNNNNNHDSTYVDEPLPMEGDFASLDLHSSSNQTLNNFLQQQQQNNQQSSSSQYPQRYDTLTWAREHALPELRQETMLATGGLHPKTSVSSINGFLDNQASSHPQHVNFPQSNPSTDRSICSSSSPSLASRTSFSITDLNNRPISPSQVNSLSSPFLNSSGCPSPALSAFGSNNLLMDPSATASSSNIPSIDINESLVASMNNTSNPAPSPHLRLDMNHPAMTNGPTISLTSATPLTAKPNHPTVDVPNFQRFLNQLSQPQPNQNNINPNDPSQMQSQNQLTSFQQSFGQIPNLDFLHLDQNFLTTKTNKGRQRSKSESVANSIQPTNSNSNPTSFSLLNLNYNPYQSSHNTNQTNPTSQTQDETQGSNNSNAFLSNHSSQAFPSSQFNLLSQALNFPPPPPPTLEDLNLGLESRNSIGGTSYETGFLQTNPNPNQSSSTSHLIHRRGRSESQIMNHFNQPNNGNLETEPKIEEWEDIITRERSYSHSSMGSSIQSKSYQISSRTTPATKAAAAKRRKEGTEARYVCEMCGETFTRRYNLRGHQRAHKGEKPFACGFPGCTSSFARAHDQKRHYKLHLGIKDYNCKVCGKAFIRLDALQRHHKSDAGQGCYYELKSKGELSYEHDSQQQGTGSGMGMEILNPSFEFCSNVLG